MPADDRRGEKGGTDDGGGISLPIRAESPGMSPVGGGKGVRRLENDRSGLQPARYRNRVAGEKGIGRGWTIDGCRDLRLANLPFRQWQGASRVDSQVWTRHRPG